MKNGERAYGFNDTHREGEHEQNTIYMTLYEARFSEARRFRSRLRTAAARVRRGKEIRVGGAADLRISKTKKQDENGNGGGLSVVVHDGVPVVAVAAPNSIRVV